MGKLRTLSLVLLISIGVMAIEICLIARATLGVFDPRCLVLNGYIVAHTYAAGREVIRCTHETL